MKRFLFSAMVTLVLTLALSVAVVSAAVEQLSLERLTSIANAIIIGRVVSQNSHWNADHSRIVTDVSFVIVASVKGDKTGCLLLQVPGGVVGDLGLTVSDEPGFTDGETAILFLSDADIPGLHLVGRYQGKLAVIGGQVYSWDGTATPLDAFLRRVRSIDGATGPLPDDLAAAVASLSPSPEQATSPGLQAPVITSIVPNFGPAHGDQLRDTGVGCAANSTQFTITGTGFGATQGANSYVRIWAKENTYFQACIQSWSNTQIVARLSAGPGYGPSSGPVAVVVAGVVSNEMPFNITYSDLGGRWAGNPSFFVNPTVAGVPAGNALAAVQAAAAAWNNACANFHFNYAGPTGKTAVGGDLENDIIWSVLPTGTVVNTDFYYYTNDPHHIVDSDITFNSAYPWATNGDAQKMDIMNAGTGGYAFSLPLAPQFGVPDMEKSTYAIIQLGETSKRTLAPEDIQGIQGIYGLGGCTPTPTATPTRTPTRTATATPSATPTFVNTPIGGWPHPIYLPVVLALY